MTTFDGVLTQWMQTPIAIGDNPVLPGRKFGDDSGYRNMKTLQGNPAPLVHVEIARRPCYEGMSMYTGQFVGGALGGGLRQGAFMLRQAPAISVNIADQVLRSLSGEEFSFVGLDAFRSGLRQQLGYSVKLFEQMQMIGLTADEVNNGKRIGEFVGCSQRADGVFSWVKVPQDVEYHAKRSELTSDRAVSEQFFQHGESSSMSVDDVVYEYIIASRNSGLGLATTGTQLVCENNAHAGGGAVDLMIVQKGRLKAITPFDYPGWMSAYDFMETDENYDVYRAKLRDDAVLQHHLRQCGYEPTSFTWNNWTELRDIKRVQYHLARACKWTFYSMGRDGGEHWHEEPGNIVYHPLTGQVVWAEPQTAGEYPDRGNPGHSLQLFGADDIAVWGGRTAHEIAVERHGLEMAI